MVLDQRWAAADSDLGQVCHDQKTRLQILFCRAFQVLQDFQARTGYQGLMDVKVCVAVLFCIGLLYYIYTTVHVFLVCT